MWLTIPIFRSKTHPVNARLRSLGIAPEDALRNWLWLVEKVAAALVWDAIEVRRGG